MKKPCLFDIYLYLQISTLHLMCTAIESGNLKAWKKAYVTTVALGSVLLIFMNFDTILGLKTHPSPSESWIGLFWLSEASQDLTLMSNSPAIKRGLLESDGINNAHTPDLKVLTSNEQPTNQYQALDILSLD